MAQTITLNRWKSCRKKVAFCWLPFIGIALLVIWCAGFVWFAFDAAHMRQLPPFETDGIVVLTGGKGRIDAALNLLRTHRGHYLLISGVNQETSLKELQAILGMDLPSDIRSHIVLGHQAQTTVGNANETANWVQANDLHNLIVVTAGYHIRRAMIEMRATLPETTLYPYIAHSPIMDHPLNPHSLHLLFKEYNKCIAAYMGITHRPTLAKTV